MLSRIASGLKRRIQQALAFLTRHDSRTARWAARALSAKRTLWHRDRLSACAAQLERSFVGVSAALEGLAGRSASLLESSRALLKCSSGQDGAQEADGETSIFQSAIGTIEQPLNFNDECLEITAKVDADLARLALRIGRLDQFKTNLDASTAPLRILQTMFRIESASSPPEILSLFVSLSAEIEHLMEQMATLIAREFEAIESTAATIHNVAGQVRTLHARQIEASKRRAGIEASVAALARQIEADKARDRRLVGVTEAISERIAGMVGALQYQDILNQRLQHVIEGLTDIAGQSHALRQRVARPAGALAFLRDASRVEAAQLEGVEEVLDAVVGRLRSALGGLAQQACELGAGTGGSAVDGMIQVLLDTIRENTELVEATSRQTHEISAALYPIGGMLGNLTGTIFRLSARIRLISLNAQIQAAQAGDGTGLEVLACHARTIAEEIVVHVGELAGTLDALKNELSGSLDDIASMETRSAEFLRFLQAEGSGRRDRLLRFKDRMSAELKNASERIEQIQTESASLASSLGITSSILEIIDRARAELHAFSEALAARLRHNTRSARIDEHARSYTAAAERSAHQSALLGNNTGGLIPAPASPAVEGTVELF